jgi:conjugative relaxase-like TrwC/TraI family protein
VVAVISVAMLGGGAGASGYYLDRAADCELPEYYTGEKEAPGRWCGAGAAAVGLDGAVTGDAARVFAGLLEGRLPDGTVVAKPLWRSDSRGQLPAEPLVRELRRAAAASEVEVTQLFTDPELAHTATALMARVDTARPSQRHTIRVDARRVGELALAAGVNPHVLYPGTRRQRGYATALQHAGEKVDARRCGIDVVVSAPKSVSVMFGLADPTIAQTVAAAHEHAVSEALGYLERHTSHGLRGHQGDGQRAAHVATDGFVAAGFTHHTSRADDPQLHTHLVIANVVHGVDGKWSAVDSRAVHRHARTAGCIYQAVLRGELTRELGVAWGPVRKGVAEIEGVPRALRRAFSQRREQIEAELDRTGSTSRRAAQRATYRTRPDKTHIPERSLRQWWAERAIELGHDPRGLIASLLGRTRAPELPAKEVVARQLFGPDGLTARATSFDRRDVIQSLTESLPVGLPSAGRELEGAADRMLAERDAIPLLQTTQARGDEPRWTSADLLATERTALILAGGTSGVPALDPQQAGRTAASAGLSGEQRRLVAGLLSSPRLVDVVVGPAGSGKTALLRAAGTGWHDTGVPVLGCSLAAVTARRLEAATGIPTSSLARLLADANRIDPTTGQAQGLPAQTVVIIDEASMVGTRDLAALATHVAGRRGKLVLVGDPAQLPEIDAGGLFAALARHAEPLTLTANQRQQHAWERDALLALRDGDSDTALDAYVTHDRIRVGLDAADTRRQLVADYVTRRATGTGAFDLVALAGTRADVTALNAAIRAALQQSGHVHTEGMTVLTGAGPRGYAAGDLVIVTRNDQPRQLLNGTRAVISQTTGTDLQLATDTGITVTVPAGWAAEHLDHGYALTVHKAQGLTATTALVYGTVALDQHAGYVALSRGRQDNHLYTSIDSLTVDRDDIDLPTFQLLDRDHPDLRDTLAERLARSRQHVLAHDQQPYAGYDIDDQRQRQRDYDYHRHDRGGYGIER